MCNKDHLAEGSSEWSANNMMGTLDKLKGDEAVTNNFHISKGSKRSWKTCALGTLPLW